MPVASTDLDWSGIRAAAVALRNVRAAARQATANLPEPERTTVIERINKRALREGWLDKADAHRAVHSAETALSKPVQNGHEIIAGSQAEDERETRFSHSRLARKLAKQAESSEIVIQTPADVLALVKHYAVTHRIDQDKSGPHLTLNLFAVQSGIEPPATDI